MGHTDVRDRGAELIGRERECAEIDRLLEQRRAGESAALVIRGEAGIGKSALLEYAAQRAAEMTVLRATGVEAESDLAFAGLYGLLRPVLGHLDERAGDSGGGAGRSARTGAVDRRLIASSSRPRCSACSPPPPRSGRCCA